MKCAPVHFVTSAQILFEINVMRFLKLLAVLIWWGKTRITLWLKFAAAGRVALEG
jgi:hypothetical protein